MLTFIVQISNANFRLAPNHSLTIELQSINQVKSHNSSLVLYFLRHGADAVE